MSDAKSQHEPSMEEILASIRRIIAEDGDAAPAGSAAAESAAPSAAAAPAPRDEPPIDEILELTEVVEDDGSVVPFGSRAAPEPPPPPPPPPSAFDFEDEPPPPPPLRGGDPYDRLVSDATAAASVAALSHLVARGQRDELPMGPNRTLEDIVRELIRPMLKNWLDEKLPYMVERIVQDEIARLVRDAQGH